MGNLTVTKEELRQNKQLYELCKQEEIEYLAVFGSVSRGEANEQSDIDLLIRFAGSHSLFKLIRVSQKMSDILGTHVDLLTEKSVSPYIIERIQRDIEVIYSE